MHVSVCLSVAAFALLTKNCALHDTSSTGTVVIIVSWEALSSKAPPVVYTVKITRVGIFPLYSIWNIAYIP